MAEMDEKLVNNTTSDNNSDAKNSDIKNKADINFQSSIFEAKTYSARESDEPSQELAREAEYEKTMKRLRKEYVGNILDERYQILEVVGKGGMACVLKAKDIAMNRIVAIKILDSELNEDPAAVERFKNESQAIAMMSHKNIVTVYDVAFHDDMKYIVMEFLHGKTFEKYLSQKETLPWKEACYYMYKILGALEHSHQNGIIHSDVKPQNMMVDKDGEIMLTDFGIASVSSEISGTNNFPKEALGTAYYMSPEQAQGKPVTVQSDVYSVGVILYEAIAGRLPFVDSDPYVVMEKHISETAVSPASYADDIPDGLVQIITKAMRKNADERYLTAKEMADAIEEISKNPTKTFDGIEIPDIALVDDIESKQRAKAKKAEIRRKNREARREAKLSSPVSRSFFPIITGVTLAFIIVSEATLAMLMWKVFERINIASALETLFYTDNEMLYTMPKLVGENAAEILAASENGELVDNKGNRIYINPEGITAEFNSEYEQGVIIQQTPAQNMQKKDNVIDSIVISLGSERVFMPDVMFMSRMEAETIIKSTVGDDYTIKFIEATHDFAHADQVIRTEPEAGNLVVKSNSGVDIKVYYCESESFSEIRMPDLVGLTLEEAERILKNNNINIGKEIKTVDTLTSGVIVMEQSIAPYTLVMPHSATVYLTVSKQVDIAPMIDVVGLKSDDAKKQLKVFGLKNVKTEYVYTSAEEGIVIKQSIEEGENVSANTVVTIYVNVQTETNIVPDIVGKTAEEADSLLLEAGIDSVLLPPEKSFFPTGTVIYQSVAAGEEIVKGKKLEYTISVESESITMKNCKGEDPEEIIAWFEKVGISYTIGDAVDSNEKPGVIVSQSVPMYSEVYKGETVVIYVNKYVPAENSTTEGNE